MESRPIELVCGVLAGALGLTALGVGLFAPVWRWYCDPIPPQNSCNPYVTGVQYALQLEHAGIVLYYTTGIAVPSLGIVLFAIWHSRARSLPVLVLLWVCTVLLGAGMVNVGLNPFVGPFDVLGFLVPACVLALGASIAGTVAAQQRAPAAG
jgi:hypothetical protein